MFCTILIEMSPLVNSNCHVFLHLISIITMYFLLCFVLYINNKQKNEKRLLGESGIRRIEAGIPKFHRQDASHPLLFRIYSTRLKCQNERNCRLK